MVVVSDVIRWTRRLIKDSNAQSISDTTILDYLNRFYLYDIPYRIQQFELKTQYSFDSQPNIDRYNLPIDTYNSLLTPCFVDGLQMIMSQSNSQFNTYFPSLISNGTQAVGDGATAAYAFTQAGIPFIRGHADVLGNVSPGVYVTAQAVGGANMVLTDDGVGNLVGSGTGTVNHLTGAFAFTFNFPVAVNQPVRTQTIPYTAGRPQAALFYSNVITLRPVPDKPYLITFDAYLTPSAFLNTGAGVTFNWMADYLAHGTARRILKDLGDVELLQYNEPFFMEQERQVLRRTSRQNSNTRVSTLFQAQTGNAQGPIGTY